MGPNPASPPSTSHVEAAGHSLRVQVLRPGGGATLAPTLVLLHEGLGSILQWRDVPRRLLERTGLPVLAYDRWGFGGSDPLELPRPDDYLETESDVALPDVLAACGVGRHVLIGHSDGATIALLSAARRPAGLLGVVAIAAHVFVEACTAAGVAAAAEAWGSGDMPRALARYHGDKAEAMFRGWAETWLRPSFSRWEMTGRLPQVACPVLVVQGDRDEYGTLAQVNAIATGVSGPAEILIVPDCGHDPHLERPDIVLPAIARFVEKAAGV
jgi:pimeloyl-ACP methyl ester carboxylesterase